MPSSGKLVWVQEAMGVKKHCAKLFQQPLKQNRSSLLIEKKTFPRRQKELNRTLDFPESGRTAAMLVWADKKSSIKRTSFQSSKSFQL